jgi:phosphoglycerol transferase MdoB-like AlkP superfamily enzyme
MTNLKILIVDDDENICELLRLYLEKDGYETIIANDGEKAVEYAAKYSLPNLLKQEGYSTAFFHNWDEYFYTRGKTNKNIGFDNVYTIDDFTHENKSTAFNFYNLETDFANQLMDKIAPTNGNPFMSFYTTISTHGLYDVTNPRFEKYFKTYDTNLEKMKSWFLDEGYHYPTDEYMQSVLKEYKSAAMDTDEMIGNLFKHLKDNEMLDNTTVVIYSDHHAFYHDLTNEVKSTIKADYSSQESYVVPLMIYSEKIAPKTIDSFCSPYDLYPTLCEMYGLPYNTLNALGKDMLSENISETIYYSHLTGFYDSKCYSKNMQYIQKYKNTSDEDVQKFKDKACEILAKQRKLNIIYNSRATY